MTSSWRVARRALAACFMLVSCSPYSSTLKMEPTCSSEASVDFQKTYGVISQKIGHIISSCTRYAAIVYGAGWIFCYTFLSSLWSRMAWDLFSFWLEETASKYEGLCSRQGVVLEELCMGLLFSHRQELPQMVMDFDSVFPGWRTMAECCVTGMNIRVPKARSSSTSWITITMELCIHCRVFWVSYRFKW
jgi:hypothetical protein